ncbi:tetratricopeptide repeat protein [Mycobacteroides immunogenum]|uniref:tetratricopeptide repeat protein n=1 Tax=Mycobacteroides immunogenum TaxID=83262 RepID=UPI0006C88655|nr:tetratricopeptide repeat protein [Mycobacteroides immunogenum]
MLAYSKLKQALADPLHDPQTLFEDARELSKALVRSGSLVASPPRDAATVMVSGFERAGEGGVAQSYMELAGLYCLGGSWRSPLLPKDDDRAIELFGLAERLGHPDASFELAKTVYYAKRVDLAEEAWRRAEAFSDSAPERTDALVLVGYLLKAGFGVAPDLIAAARKFHAAAKRFDADACFELAVLSSTGTGMPQDSDAALAYMFWAAELGSTRAQYNLGAFYGAGTDGLPRDGKMSLRWYRKAADANHGQAALTAALMLLTGDGGVTVDPEQAAELLTHAARLLGRDAVKERLTAMGLRSCD